MSDLAQEWAEKLDDWNSSGLSIAAWCRRHHEGYHRFLYWRKRLSSSSAEGAGRFVELRMASAPIRLDCNGVGIHLERGFDPGLLRDILAALKTV